MCVDHDKPRDIFTDAGRTTLQYTNLYNLDSKKVWTL